VLSMMVLFSLGQVKVALLRFWVHVFMTIFVAFKVMDIKLCENLQLSLSDNLIEFDFTDEKCFLSGLNNEREFSMGYGESHRT